MEKRTMIELFGTDLQASRTTYQFQVGNGHSRTNPDGEGVIIEVTIPKFEGDKKVLYVENRHPNGGPPLTEGVMSDSPDAFGETKPLSRKVWGLTGKLKVDLTARDQGRVIYIGHRPNSKEFRKPGWLSSLVIGFRTPT